MLQGPTASKKADHVRQWLAGGESDVGGDGSRMDGGCHDEKELYRIIIWCCNSAGGSGSR